MSYSSSYTFYDFLRVTQAAFINAFILQAYYKESFIA